MSALDLLPADTLDAIRTKKPGLREDLRLIGAAECNGWKVTFRNDHWHNSAEFEKGSIAIWWSALWRAADLIEGRYVNHRRYTTLREALEAEGGPLT